MWHSLIVKCNIKTNIDNMGKSRIILFAAIAMIFAACKGDDMTDIRTAAQGYLDAMGNYKPTEARAYATKETCEQTLSFYEELLKHTDPKVFANNMPAEITLGNVTIEDSTAVIEFHKHTPITEQDGTLALVKRDKKWQVDEVINVPPMLNPKTLQEGGRKFTDEQIQQMRRNGAKSSKELKVQE